VVLVATGETVKKLCIDNDVSLIMGGGCASIVSQEMPEATLREYRLHDVL
jgi:hypothetical protein